MSSSHFPERALHDCAVARHIRRQSERWARPVAILEVRARKIGIHDHPRRRWAFGAKVDVLPLPRLGRVLAHELGDGLAAAEMALHVLAYNLTRVMNIIGIKPLIAALRS
jgi:hypothetical protein